jgi:hypothetical protein
MALRHVVLTVLARGDMTGYEITKNFETVYSRFWRASHQQVCLSGTGTTQRGRSRQFEGSSPGRQTSEEDLLDHQPRAGRVAAMGHRTHRDSTIAIRHASEASRMRDCRQGSLQARI